MLDSLLSELSIGMERDEKEREGECDPLLLDPPFEELDPAFLDDGTIGSFPEIDPLFLDGADLIQDATELLRSFEHSGHHRASNQEYKELLMRGITPGITHKGIKLRPILPKPSRDKLTKLHRERARIKRRPKFKDGYKKGGRTREARENDNDNEVRSFYCTLLCLYGPLTHIYVQFRSYRYLIERTTSILTVDPGVFQFKANFCKTSQPTVTAYTSCKSEGILPSRPFGRARFQKYSFTGSAETDYSVQSLSLASGRQPLSG